MPAADADSNGGVKPLDNKAQPSRVGEPLVVVHRVIPEAVSRLRICGNEQAPARAGPSMSPLWRLVYSPSAGYRTPGRGGQPPVTTCATGVRNGP